jgi:bifunctional DNase/RNase
MIEVNIQAVRIDIGSNTPVVLLQEVEGKNRSLPIFIGEMEASAINLMVNEVESPRPLTHDLFKIMLESLNSSLTYVEITELRDKIYFAEIHILNAQKDEIKISARPSDAIALGLKAGVPIYVSDELMEIEGIEINLLYESEENEKDSEELIEDFTDFLDQVKPDDFL